MVVSFPDEQGNVNCYDFELGIIFQTNVDSPGFKHAKKFREVEERDWCWSGVMGEIGVRADEELLYEVGEYLGWR